jgi:hypothetical protein
MQSPFGWESERHFIINVIVFTRHWIHYGTILLVFVATMAAAAEGLLLR